MYKITLTVIAIISSIVIVSSPFINLNNAKAISGSDFKAGRIIDDYIFTNKDTMSVAQIQQFLSAKVPNCEIWHSAYDANNPPPYTCLKDYQENPTNGDNNFGRYVGNAPYQVPGGKSSAQIIWEAAQAYSINPQVLIVLLQKEQALVTDTWPLRSQFTKAMGYLCPDTAPCSASAGGFYKQVSGAAWQFRHDFNGIDTPNYWSPYGKGWNNIYYNPSTSCGTRSVFIETQATAVLYKYTPYTPNDAALAVMNDNTAGGTVNCGAYGNRNFFWYFNKWFGSTEVKYPYLWQYITHEAYMDQGYTQKITGEMQVVTNSNIYLKLKARNIGGKIWYKNEINLGTARNNDRSSIFATNSWLNPARPATLAEDVVYPGSTGTFIFTVKAPNSAGAYNEYFNLVAEGKSWFNDLGAYFRINVTNSTNSQPADSTKLLPGQTLNRGEVLLSADKNVVLNLQNDGNLVLYYPFSRPAWHTYTNGSSAQKFVMQQDGNLVLYDNNNKPIWNSVTNGNPGSYLVIQQDGNLVIYNSQNNPLWATYTFHFPNFGNYVSTTLNQGVLLPGQKLETPNRVYSLILQQDGNLVLYKNNIPIWATETDGKQVKFLANQSDGNLVLYDIYMKPLWYSKTSGTGYGSNLILQQDGNLVLYNRNEIPTWNTATNGR